MFALLRILNVQQTQILGDLARGQAALTAITTAMECLIKHRSISPMLK